MLRWKTNDHSHSNSPRLFGCGAEGSTRNTIAPHNFRALTTNSFPRCIVFQLGTIARHFEASFQDQLTVLFAYRGVLSWVDYLRRSRERLPKPAVKIVGIPTHLSVMSFPTSRRGRFGLKIQRLASPLRAAAAFVWPSGILAAIATGPALRSPPSSPKFSGATICGTSRSFPNGRRRPF